jgi:hypothetical protein
MILDMSIKYQSRQQEFVSLSPLNFYIYVVYLGCVLYLPTLVIRLMDIFGTLIV